MAKKQNKPGVMLYFDVRPSLNRMSREQQGELFCAILDYGEHGIEPEFSDRSLYFVWDFIKPKIEKDDDAYREKKEKAKASANARWNTSKNANAQNEMQPDANGRVRMQTDADGCGGMRSMPTSYSSTTSPSKPTSKANLDDVPFPDVQTAEVYMPVVNVQVPSQYETGFSDAMQRTFEDWVQYKSREKREPYKEIGLRVLVSQIRKNVETYGERFVIETIERSISSGWKGIAWDSCGKIKEEIQRQEELKRKKENELPF